MGLSGPSSASNAAGNTHNQSSQGSVPNAAESQAFTDRMSQAFSSLYEDDQKKIKRREANKKSNFSGLHKDQESTSVFEEESNEPSIQDMVQNIQQHLQVIEAEVPELSEALGDVIEKRLDEIKNIKNTPPQIEDTDA